MLCMKNPFILVKAQKQTVDGVIQTLEDKVGDFIVIGIANEQWPVKPDKNIFWPSGKVLRIMKLLKKQVKLNQVEI